MSRARKQPPPTPAAPVKSFPGWLAAAVILAAICLAYGNVLRAPFIFDDGPSIVENETIRSVFPLSQSLNPPTKGGPGVAGRPLVNLSLAVNYAMSGLEPWSYHATNILIHALVALVLFGLVRRTLEGPVLRARWAGRAGPVAFALTLLWALHPLLTESVTCVIQRTESLFGLCYLLTLHAFARAATTEAARPRATWSILCVLACLLGMATKEAMITAPVIALLYDRTFVSGSFRGVARQRWLYYGLFATWALLFFLLQGNPMRGGTAGYAKVTWWDYLVTQCDAIVIYLKLTVWPHPLVLDYGMYLAPGLGAVLPQAIFLVALAAGTVWALWRHPVAGFLGAWFFVILSPSSSVIPLVTQTIAEHRMYLPLLAPLALGVGALALRSAALVLPVAATLGLVLGVVTFQRNQMYRHPRELWRENLRHRPDNLRVHHGLADAADKDGDFAAAAGHYADFLQHHPEAAETRYNYARDLVKVGRIPEALENFEQVIKAMPANMDVRTNYATCLLRLERYDDAVRQFELVLRVRPDDPDDRFNFAEALKKIGRLDEAIEQYRRGVALRPTAGFMHYRLGDALLQAKRPAEAVEAYRAAVSHQPDLFAAWMNLGGTYMMTGRTAEGVTAFEAAVRLNPNDPAAQRNLTIARGMLRQ